MGHFYRKLKRRIIETTGKSLYRRNFAKYNRSLSPNDEKIWEYETDFLHLIEAELYQYLGHYLDSEIDPERPYDTIRKINLLQNKGMFWL